jgi:hypothetical protein
MTLYKLTDSKNLTRNDTKWGKGKTIELPPTENPRLCSEYVIHAYRSVNLGLLLNPMHGQFNNPNIWESEGDVVVEDFGKVGCFSLQTIKRLRKPGWYTNKSSRGKVQVLFAILCAETVLSYYEKHNPNNNAPREAIEVAKEYLKNPSADAAYAARAAAYAARAAAYAARAAAYAARAAAYAARAAAYAADAARAAADAADAADAELDFTKIADLAVDMTTKKVLIA